MFRVKKDFAPMRTRALLLCASALTLGGVTPVDAAWNPDNPNPHNFDTEKIMQEIKNPHSDLVTIAAHRGIHALVRTNQAPKVAENSLQAIGMAAQEGWETIEIDVKLTSDGVPILSHDKTWGREWCYDDSGDDEPPSWRGPFDPHNRNNPGNVGKNPRVDGTTLADTRWSILTYNSVLRDSVSLYCGGLFDYREWAPTLDEVYDYIAWNKIQMVVTLDVQAVDVAEKAWQVVQRKTDHKGRNFAKSTIFKIPAKLMKTTNDFKRVFGSSYSEVRFNPVFHTGWIAPNEFGSEQAMIDWIRAYQADPSINIVAIEVTMKDPPPGGILSSVLSVAQRHTITGQPVTISNFNPVGEYYPDPTPSDPQPQAAFFSSEDGYCCDYLSKHLFNNEDYEGPIKYPNLPYDHQDHRQSVSFLVEDARAQMITTDRPDVLQKYLLAHGRRNICYLQEGDCSGGAGGSIGTRNHGQYAKPLRVLPLGDSITWGMSSSTGSGYRGPLRAALLNGGFSVDFVGSITSGTMTDPYNEGHSGWRIDQIAGSTTQVVQKYQPNVVLLMAGTNDMAQGYDLGNAPTRLGDLTEQILAASPNTTVLVASLVPASDAAIDNNIKAFNAKLPELVAQKRRQGLAVYFVDMSSFPPSALADVLHPNDAGYQLMADQWLPAIRDVALAIEPAVDCNSISAGCNDPALGSESSGPRPRQPANGWSAPVNLASGTNNPGVVEYADMNGDGRDDYVILNPSTGALIVYMNNNAETAGGGGWTGPLSYASGVAPGGRVRLADINADGKADYLVVDPTTGAVDAWLNNGGEQNGGGWNPIGRVASGVALGSRVHLADITADGRADYLVVDPETGAVDAWVNNGMEVPGGGGWIPKGRIASGVAPGSMVRFADFNNDRYDDYIVLNPITGAMGVWLNDNAAETRNWVQLGRIAPGVGAPGTSVQLGDVNGDGAVDYLVVSGSQGQTNAWLNNGGDLESNLPPSTLFASPASPRPRQAVNGWSSPLNVASGTDVPGLVQYTDMNGDGRSDYVVMNPSNGALTVYMNNGAENGGGGGWSAPISYASGVAPGSWVRLADINADGKSDYLVVDPSNGAVKAWLNRPNDAWLYGSGDLETEGWSYIGQIAQGVGAQGDRVRFADINGDGYADYLVVDPETGAVDGWLNNGMQVPGGGSWTTLGRIASGVALGSMVRFADFNNDFLDDYIVLNPISGAMGVWLNDNAAVTRNWIQLGRITSGVAAPGAQLQLGDINGDGAVDLLAVSGNRGQTTGWLNQGGHLESSLPPPGIFAAPTAPKGPLPRNGWTLVHSIAAGTDRVGILDYVDMNGDRKADYVIKDVGSGALTVYINNGTEAAGGGGWGPPIAYASGAAPGARVALADVSGDGRADYLVVDPDSGSVTAWLNNGGEQSGLGWTYLGKVAAGAAPGEFVRFADLNGDGHADYLVVDRDTGAVTAWLNNGMDLPGGGGWVAQGTVALGAAPARNVLFADLNNDNRADYLILDHDTGALSAWLNNGMDVPGGNGWASLGLIFHGAGSSDGDVGRVIADINADGAADYLLVQNASGQTNGYLNNGGVPLP